MQLTSPVFSEGGPIPEVHTGEGRNLSPPLKWSGAPPNTRAFVLIVDDPDASSGNWVHWVLYDLPATATELPADLARSQYVAGAMQGLNDFRHLGYGGPMPPPGKPHRYFFKLYALDRPLELKPGLSKREIEHAMAKNVIAQAQLMGTYQRW